MGSSDHLPITIRLSVRYYVTIHTRNTWIILFCSARAWAKYCWPEEDWLSLEALNKLFRNNKVLCKIHFADDCFANESKKNLGRFSVPGEKHYVTNLLESLKKDMHLMRQSDETPHATEDSLVTEDVPEKPDALSTSLTRSPLPVPPKDLLPEENAQHSAAATAEGQTVGTAVDDADTKNYSDIETEYLEDLEDIETTNVDNRIDVHNNSNTEVEYLEDIEDNETTTIDVHNNSNLEEEYLEDIEDAQSDINEASTVNSNIGQHDHSNHDGENLEEDLFTIADAEEEVESTSPTNLLIYDPALQPVKDVMCATCCSSGRTILPLTQNKNFDLMQTFCSEIKFTEEDKICWECDAVLNKMNNFKQRALKAQNILADIMNGGQMVIMQTLSHMTTTDISGVVIDPSADLTSNIEELVLDRREDLIESEWAHDSLPTSPGDTEMVIENEEPGSLSLNIPTTEMPSEPVNIPTRRKRSAPVNIPSTNKPVSKTRLKPKVNYNVVHIPKIKEAANAFTEPHLLKEACKQTVLSEEVLLQYMDTLRCKLVNSKQFKCLKCLTRYKSIENFNKHNERHDPRAGEHVCKICEQRFLDAATCASHYDKHFVFFECSSCGVLMKGRDKMLAHFDKMHREQRRVCRDCGQVFMYFSEFQQHRLAAHGPKLICKHCGKIFREPSNFAKHLRVHIRDRKKAEKYKCKLCDEAFSWLRQLKKHMVDTHGLAPDNKCVTCNIQFVDTKTYKSHLKTMKHMKLANEPTANYICEDCGRVYSTSSLLSAHRRHFHVYEKCICDICNKVFLTKALLIRHMQYSSTHKPDSMKNKKCELCGKSFYSISTLKSHIYSHNAERQFVCEICGAAYQAPKGLHKHRMNVHKVSKTRQRIHNDLTYQLFDA